MTLTPPSRDKGEMSNQIPIDKLIALTKAWEAAAARVLTLGRTPRSHAEVAAATKRACAAELAAIFPVRDLGELLTSEMTQLEWLRFRDEWITGYANDLVVECGNDPEDPSLQTVAEVRWEDYCGQEGWTGRDERLAMKREGYTP